MLDLKARIGVVPSASVSLGSPDRLAKRSDSKHLFVTRSPPSERTTRY